MITVDQDLWNLLFGWMQEGQCMLPEGCTAPLPGLAFYIGVVLVIAAVVHWRDRILKGKADKLDFIAELLDGL